MWLWSTQVVRELMRREMLDTALALGDCHVAARYDGPDVEDLGDTALVALACTFSPPDALSLWSGSVTAAT